MYERKNCNTSSITKIIAIVFATITIIAMMLSWKYGIQLLTSIDYMFTNMEKAQEIIETSSTGLFIWLGISITSGFISKILWDL